ncbi:KGG domain-containing protein [Caulobacter endophyticus]|uniref:Stress-induced protein n=1 Tax=Caulobacter endophyticus TaxID=2172652 RepID=A0A2T9JI63_9CAUL|nr:KGG domain-containing protein [Caulobacter endophyticus]PVM83377.1 stress-induced protein [Caulobacter endophyticus]
MAVQTETSSKSKRGFAAMSPDRRRAIAAKGGASAPAEKRSFSQNRDLAVSAGRAGGSVGRARGEA